jgi:prepilin signal peptidase PulO-like enzyme (type II secretory pathway)
VEALALILGWAVGIGINVLADSLPQRSPPGKPRCQACGAPRRVTAWSGVVGLLRGAGRCAYCGRARGARAPVVEIVGACAGLATFAAFPEAGRFLGALAVFAVFLLIVVTDLEHRLILNVVVLPAGALFILIGSLDPTRGPVKTLLGGLAGFAGFFFLYLLGGVFGRAVSRIRGEPLAEVPFGFGDVNLAGLIGLAVGWPGVVVALLLGIFTAGAFSLLYLAWMAVRRRYSAFTPFPYGPFLVLGALAVYFRVWTFAFT